MTNEARRVFCKDCRHYRTVRTIDTNMAAHTLHTCDAEPIERAHPIRGLRMVPADPMVRNAGCDCALFEVKPAPVETKRERLWFYAAASSALLGIFKTGQMLTWGQRKEARRVIEMVRVAEKSLRADTQQGENENATDEHR